MAYLKRHRVFLNVTATGGTSQSFFTPPVFGHVEALTLTRATATGLTTAANVLVTAERSGQVILNVSATNNTFYPRALAQTSAGAIRPGVSTADTSMGFPVPIPVANERVAVQVSSGNASAVAGGLSTNNFIDIYISGA